MLSLLLPSLLLSTSKFQEISWILQHSNMITKINSQASEQINKNDREGYLKKLLFISKRAVENKEKNVLKLLITELKSFVKRNSIEGGYCQRCLKAHALRKADEFGMSKDSVKFIDILSDQEAGHIGYYLDEDDLIRIG